MIVPVDRSHQQQSNLYPTNITENSQVDAEIAIEGWEQLWTNSVCKTNASVPPQLQLFSLHGGLWRHPCMLACYPHTPSSKTTNYYHIQAHTRVHTLTLAHALDVLKPYFTRCNPYGAWSFIRHSISSAV